MVDKKLQQHEIETRRLQAVVGSSAVSLRVSAPPLPLAGPRDSAGRRTQDVLDECSLALHSFRFSDNEFELFPEKGLPKATRQHGNAAPSPRTRAPVVGSACWLRASG